MEGTRYSVTSADGVRLGLLTAGYGPALRFSYLRRTWSPGSQAGVLVHPVRCSLAGKARAAAALQRLLLEGFGRLVTSFEQWARRRSITVR